MSDDQFTSVQWDREDNAKVSNTEPMGKLTEEHDNSIGADDMNDHGDSTDPVGNDHGDYNNDHSGHLQELESGKIESPSDSLLMSKDRNETSTRTGPGSIGGASDDGGADDNANADRAMNYPNDETQGGGGIGASEGTNDFGSSDGKGDGNNQSEVERGAGMGLDNKTAPESSNNPVTTQTPNQTPTTTTMPQTSSENQTGAAGSNQAEMIHNFETYSIHTEISDPIRDIDQASKPYISYLITTETDNPSIIKLSNSKDKSSIKISCRRRYGDFRNLYHCLSNDFPTVLIPPLPSKLNLKYLTGDTFSSEFVHKRLNSLKRCIKFINSHKYLSQLSVYHLFLSDSNDWNSFSSNLKIHNINEVEKEQSFTSNMVNKVVNEEIFTETVMNFLTPSKHKRETNKEILEISDKLKKLYENLTKLDKIFVKINKKNNELGIDYNLFLTQINKLSQTQLNDGNSNNINDNFKFFGECLKQYLENWSNSFKFINESFLTSLKDCSKYIINLTNLIELQHNKKIDLEVLQDYLDKARSELSNMPTLTFSETSGSNGISNHRLPPSPIKNKTGGIVNNTTQLIKDTLSTSANGNIGSSNTEQKRNKLQAKVTQLEEEIVIQTNMVNDLINKIIYEEYPNWDKFNKNELKASMLDLCDNQIEFYKGLVENWNETEMKLMKRIDELT